MTPTAWRIEAINEEVYVTLGPPTGYPVALVDPFHNVPPHMRDQWARQLAAALEIAALLTEPLGLLFQLRVAAQALRDPSGLDVETLAPALDRYAEELERLKRTTIGGSNEA